VSEQRVKVEWVNLPGAEPYWFDTEKEAEDWVAWMQSFPLDDGPARFKITVYGKTKETVR
jgi:hypothetical protein